VGKQMRKLYFLVPGTTQRYACGGLWAELKTLALAAQLCPAEVATYRQREPETAFLDDLLAAADPDRVIFVISWGFDVAALARRLQGFHVIYHAHSAGYRTGPLGGGFGAKLRLPSRVPIMTVSRSTLGYWGQTSPHGLLYYLPNQIGDEFADRGSPRDIDVLVQARKSSTHLLQSLVPALKQHCTVFVVDSYVEDLAGLFNRAKVYLYDSAEYWAVQGVSEGFGLQPMEALACGCQVFSSVNDGLADYLDPGFNCHKIAGFSVGYDVQRILGVLATPEPRALAPEVLAEYRPENIRARLRVILGEVNDFFDYVGPQAQSRAGLGPIPDVPVRWRRLQRLLSKLQKKLRP
jgi:glycosyltransferase involved in cell wall biosynthesis